MCCGRSYPIHVDAVIVGSRSGERRVCDAFRIQSEPGLLWVVLSDWQSARNDLRLVSIAPAMLILIRIILACVLLAL